MVSGDPLTGRHARQAGLPPNIQRLDVDLERVLRRGPRSGPPNNVRGGGAGPNHGAGGGTNPIYGTPDASPDQPAGSPNLPEDVPRRQDYRSIPRDKLIIIPQQTPQWNPGEEDTIITGLASLIRETDHRPVDIDFLEQCLYDLDVSKAQLKEVIAKGEKSDKGPVQSEEWQRNRMEADRKKKIGLSHKMLHSSGKLTTLTRKNLSSFKTWELDVNSKVARVEKEYGIPCQTVVNNWIWGSIGPELRASCSQLTPNKHEATKTQEYLDLIKKAVEPDGPPGLARWSFTNFKQNDLEVIQYWHEAVHKYEQMDVDDNRLFVETFTNGLSNEGMKDDLIAMRPTNPQDCKEKALEALSMAVDKLRFSGRVIHDSAWKGLRSTGDDTDLKDFVKRRGDGNTAINSIFGQEEGDQQVKDNESPDTFNFWEEELAAITASGKYGRCWGCDSEDHLKSHCPLRREGPSGRRQAQKNQQRFGYRSTGSSFQ